MRFQLSQVLAAEGEAVAELGAEEVAEGLVRAAASEAMAERSDELCERPKRPK